MEIRDSRGEHKIRLSKCQKLDNFLETEMFAWVEVDESEMENLKHAYYNFFFFRYYSTVFLYFRRVSGKITVKRTIAKSKSRKKLSF